MIPPDRGRDVDEVISTSPSRYAKGRIHSDVHEMIVHKKSNFMISVRKVSNSWSWRRFGILEALSFADKFLAFSFFLPLNEC